MANMMALSDDLDITHLPVRERIIAAATDLFYRHGIRAVGIDVIIELAGIAKTSLYRHFPSKDDLIAAYLQRQDELFWQRWDQLAKAAASLSAEERLMGALLIIANSMEDRSYRGCAFLNAAAELTDPRHPAMRFVRDHKQRMRDRLEVAAAGGDFEDPAALADALAMLIDGAIENRLIQGSGGPSSRLPQAGRMLIDASRRKLPKERARKP